MGTNYYLQTPNNKLHIGKSSCGWTFALRVYPKLDINTLEDWVKLFHDEKNKIYDEYDSLVTYDNMYDAITHRHGNTFQYKQAPHGYSSWGDFLDRHHAVFGPNDLLRAKIDEFCIGHGAGTWDYFLTNFC